MSVPADPTRLRANRRDQGASEKNAPARKLATRIQYSNQATEWDKNESPVAVSCYCSPTSKIPPRRFHLRSPQCSTLKIHRQSKHTHPSVHRNKERLFRRFINRKSSRNPAKWMVERELPVCTFTVQHAITSPPTAANRFRANSTIFWSITKNVATMKSSGWL